MLGPTLGPSSTSIPAITTASDALCPCGSRSPTQEIFRSAFVTCSPTTSVPFLVVLVAKTRTGWKTSRTTLSVSGRQMNRHKHDREVNGEPCLEGKINPTSLDSDLATIFCIEFWCRDECLAKQATRLRALCFELKDATGFKYMADAMMYVRVCEKPKTSMLDDAKKDGEVDLAPARKRMAVERSEGQPEPVRPTAVIRPAPLQSNARLYPTAAAGPSTAPGGVSSSAGPSNARPYHDGAAGPSRALAVRPFLTGERRKFSALLQAGFSSYEKGERPTLSIPRAVLPLFSVKVPKEKTTKFAWCTTRNKLYFKSSGHELLRVPVSLEIKLPAAEDVLCRMSLVFADNDEPVRRCLTCKDKGETKKDGSKKDDHPAHVVRFLGQFGDSGDYKCKPDGSLHVDQLIKGSQLDPHFCTRLRVDFWCRNTCLRQDSHSDWRLKFEFLDPVSKKEEVLGASDFLVRVVAEPKRDAISHEEKDGLIDNVRLTPSISLSQFIEELKDVRLIIPPGTPLDELGPIDVITELSLFFLMSYEVFPEVWERFQKEFRPKLSPYQAVTLTDGTVIDTTISPVVKALALAGPDT